MTKRRPPLTYDRTLTNVAGLIGWDTCAAICGVSERSIRYWSDPECQKEIRMIDAERLDRAFMDAGGNYPPFHNLFELRLDLAQRATDAAADLARAAADTAKEAGEAVAALCLAASPTAPTSAICDAEREIEEAIEKLTEGLAVIARRKQEARR